MDGWTHTHQTKQRVSHVIPGHLVSKDFIQSLNVVKYHKIQIKFEFQFDRIIGSRVMVEKTENMRKHGRVLFHVQLDALFFFVQGPIRACGLV
jgi:hypothetical protein